MDLAGHISRCLPDSQGCRIGKGSIERFRRCFDPFGVLRTGSRECIGHGHLLSSSRWSSSSTSRMDEDRERSLRKHGMWQAEKLLEYCSLLACALESFTSVFQMRCSLRRWSHILAMDTFHYGPPIMGVGVKRLTSSRSHAPVGHSLGREMVTASTRYQRSRPRSRAWSCPFLRLTAITCVTPQLTRVHG